MDEKTNLRVLYNAEIHTQKCERSGEANIPSRAREPRNLRTCLDASTSFWRPTSGIPTTWIVKVVMRYFVGYRDIASGLCPQFINELSIDPMVMSEKLDHLSITVTSQNSLQEG